MRFCHRIESDLFLFLFQRRRRSAGVPCQVDQLANRDYTEPEFVISIRSEDDRSQVTLTLDAGTSLGASDVLAGYGLGGPSTIVNEVCLSYGKVYVGHNSLICL